MKAAVIYHKDELPEYTDADEPHVRNEDEILVSVKAVAIKHFDKSRASGKHYSSETPKSTGRVIGGDGVCTDSYTSATKGGVPAALYPLMECTVATQDLAAYPGGKDFLAAYKAKYGTADPDPYAIYGYEAMKLGLDTIASLGAKGNSKSAVLQALFAIKARNSVLGTYGFDKNGDTTLKSYGLYKVGSDGEPVFLKTITPTKTVSG